MSRAFQLTVQRSHSPYFYRLSYYTLFVILLQHFFYAVNGNSLPTVVDKLAFEVNSPPTFTGKLSHPCAPASRAVCAVST